MKHKYFILLFLLLAGITTAMAQPTAAPAVGAGNAPMINGVTVPTGQYEYVYGPGVTHTPEMVAGNDITTLTTDATVFTGAQGVFKAVGNASNATRQVNIGAINTSGWDKLYFYIYTSTTANVRILAKKTYHRLARFNGGASPTIISDGTATVEGIAPSSIIATANGWSLVCLDISSLAANYITGLTFYTAAANQTMFVAHAFLWKNAPAIAPATLIEPTRTEIRSIFSDYPTTAAGDNINTVTGQLVSPPYTSGGKTAYQLNWSAGYSSSQSTSQLNIKSASVISTADLVSEYTHLHIDVWSSVALGNNFIKVFPKDSNNDNLGNPTNLNLGPISAGTWTGYDIKLSDFNFNEADGKSLDRITLQNGVVVPTGTMVYIDNIYLYKDFVLPTAPTPHDRLVGSYTSLYSDAAGFGTIVGWSVSGATQSEVSTTPTTTDVARKLTIPSDKYVSINIPSGSYVNTIEKNFDHIHFDLWLDEPIAAGQFEIRLYSQASVDNNYNHLKTALPAMSSTQTGKWVPVVMNLNDFALGWTGGVSKENVLNAIQSIRIYNMSTNTSISCYIDNIIVDRDIYYQPNVAPEPGEETAADVIPVYGEYSSNQDGFDSEVTANTFGTPYVDGVVGNASLKFSGGTTAAPVTKTISMSSTDLMTNNGELAKTLRFDVWLDAATPNAVLKVKLNNGSEVTINPGVIVDSRWTTVEIPVFRSLGSGQPTSATRISSIAFSGTGTMYIDNIYFHSRPVNSAPVAQINSTQYYTIREAVNAAREMDGDVRIAVIADSYESHAIFFDKVADVEWESLTIYPSGGTRTVTHAGTLTSTWRSLFMFDNAAANVTIDGRLGGVEGGTSHSLVLKGKGLGHKEADPNDEKSQIKHNTVASVRYASNVTIRDCKFTTNSTTDRPSGTIQSNANDITIINNIFENCLIAGKPSETKSGEGDDAWVISVDGQGDNVPTVNKVNISDNRFYETEALTYSEIVNFRSFIKVFIKSTNTNNPIKIERNKIGGNTANWISPGRMKLGGAAAASKSGRINCIYLKSGWTHGGINLANSNSHMLVRDNEIAYIDMENRGDYVSNVIPGFAGIITQDALALVKGNKVHDVTIVSAAPAGGTQDYFMTGIRAITSGGSNRLVVEDNEVYDVSASYAANQKSKSVMVFGILASMNNNRENEFSVKGVVRNNRVIMGHPGAQEMNSYADIAGISARLDKIGANTDIQLDVYNNTVVFNASGVSGLRTIKAYDLVNQADFKEAVLNFYNNIALVQPKATGSFSGSTPVAGITRTVNHVEGTTNVFHNTVLVSPGSGATTAAFAHDYRKLSGSTIVFEEGDLRLWNNNFVNLSSKGYVYYINTEFTHPAAVYFDYNNYYVPSDGFMAGTSGTNFSVPPGKDGNSRATETNKIVTFDNWKFSNPLFYLDYKVEHDHHSRFLYPCFNSTIAPSNLSIPTVSTIAQARALQSTLAPKRFIAGRKVEMTGDKQDAKIYNTTITETNGVVNVATADRTEIIPDINSAARREYLPTVGAVNTIFTNYWTGSAFVDKVPSTTNSNPWEQDLVFAAKATANYSLPSGGLSIHDIYNDTQRNVIIGANNTLTITGYVGQEYSAKAASTNKINGSAITSTIIYAGNDGHPVTGTTRRGAATQHIFKGTYLNNKIANLQLNNNSQYFVLLHGEQPASWNPTAVTAPSNTLEITNDFAVVNPNDDAPITYPLAYSEYLTKGWHLGGLNCTWYNTELVFAGTNATTASPDLSKPQTEVINHTYRPYIGQRIPRHGIFNDEVYNLTSKSIRMVTYHDYLYVRNNLTINAGNNFEIAADKYVKVEGTTTNSGGQPGLVIKSRELDAKEFTYNKYIFPTLTGNANTQKPRPNATFIYKQGNNNVAVPATVEMYSPGEYAASSWVSPGGNKYEYRWQYFGTPVSGQAASVSGSTIYKYNYLGNTNLTGGQGGSPYWAIPSGNFSEFDGYCIYNRNKKVYEWKGNLINRDLSGRSLPYVVSPITDEQKNGVWKDFVYNDGYHMLANPYTAAIDITKIGFGEGLEATVYIYNTGTNTDYRQQTHEGANTLFLGSHPGQTMKIPKNYAGKTVSVTDGTVTFPRYIPSMQGFNVKALSTSTSSNNKITINYPDVDKNDMPQRAPAYEPEMSYLLVELSQEENVDRILLATHPNTNKGFDNGWDGRIIPPLTASLSLFTIEEEDVEEPYYQVSTMDDFNDTYLGIVVGNMKPADSADSDTEALVEYKLTFNHSDLDYKLFLEDMHLNDTIDISQTGTSYTFTEERSSEILKRFKLIVQKGSGSETGLSSDSLKEQPVRVYSSGKNLIIDNPGEQGTVSIYDIAGKQLYSETIAAKRKTSMDMRLGSGVYLVRILIENNVQTTKIVLN